jgi:hypothetical protein
VLERFWHLQGLTRISVHAGSNGSIAFHGEIERFTTLSLDDCADGPIAEHGPRDRVAQRIFSFCAELGLIDQDRREAVRPIGRSVVLVEVVVLLWSPSRFCLHSIREAVCPTLKENPIYKSPAISEKDQLSIAQPRLFQQVLRK